MKILIDFISNDLISLFNKFVGYILKHSCNKEFWEELISYCPWYDTGHIENGASNNNSIVAYVFVTTVKFLPSRCLTTIGGFLPSRYLVTMRGYTYRHTGWWEGFFSLLSYFKKWSRLMRSLVMYLKNRKHNKWLSMLSKQYRYEIFVFQYRMYFTTCFDSREPSSGDSFTKAYMYWIAMLPNTAILVCIYTYLHLHLK
jgi:hypothetical protein